MRYITLTGLIVCGDFFFKVFFAFSLITLSSYNRTELGISFLILKSLVMVASALKKSVLLWSPLEIWEMPKRYTEWMLGGKPGV